MLSTRNRRPTGRFSGEQAYIHQLMKTYGVQVLFYGHDHVFAMEEKRDANGKGEGIYYLTGGQMGGRASPRWSRRKWFRKAYDYDRDGKPDFLTDNRGRATVKGFVKVTVHGTHSIELDIIKTDLNSKRRNGRSVFKKTIH